jgi:ABC-type antimicrobial peptide transport system permease subunit
MVTQFTSKINYAIGFDQIWTYYPIVQFMDDYNIFTLFFSLLINLIITILSILSIILIYSLLMINVENRTFELGILRMIGMQRFGLITLILTMSFSYSIP